MKWFRRRDWLKRSTLRLAIFWVTPSKDSVLAGSPCLADMESSRASGKEMAWSVSPFPSRPLTRGWAERREVAKARGS